MSRQLTVSLGEFGADPERLEVLHRQVRDELRHAEDLSVDELALDASAAPRRTPEKPAGTRGLGPAEISALSVAVLGSGGVTALLASLKAWLGRGHEAERTVRLEIDGDVVVLSHTTDSEREELLRIFLQRHGLEATS